MNAHRKLRILSITLHSRQASTDDQLIILCHSINLQEAITKDAQDHASGSDMDLKSYLADAYLHPIFHSFEEVDLVEVKVDRSPAADVSQSQSELSSPSPEREHEPEHEHHLDGEDEPPSEVHHYEAAESHYETVYQYHYEVESPNHMYRYNAEPHYQYYHY